MYISESDIITLALIFLLGGSFLVAYVALYNKRKQKHLEEKLFLRKQFEEELTKTQMEVQEQTLKTIAADIHDNVGQLLSLSKLTLGTVDTAKDPGKAQVKIASALTLLDTSIKDLRQLASLLYADNLLAGGLENAVQNELHRMARTEQYEINWQCNGNVTKEINKQHALIVFRIFQELVNNVVKHANASCINVTFEYSNEYLVIEIADNGRGFNVNDALDNPKGLGLTTLFKRAKMINADLTLTSEKDKGTVAILKIPYQNL